MALVARTITASGATVEIWDDHAAVPGSPDYDRVADEQREAATRILRRAAHRRMEESGYDLGDCDAWRRADFADCGCRIRSR